MAVYDVEVKIDEVQKALAETGKSIKSITKQTLGIIGKGIKTQINSALKSTDLNLGHGQLAKGFIYKVKKDATAVNVWPNTTDWGSDVFPQSAVLSYGHYGPTARAKSFTVEPRGFIQHGKNWFNAGLFNSDVDKMVEKQLKKWWS